MNENSPTREENRSIVLRRVANRLFQFRRLDVGGFSIISHSIYRCRVMVVRRALTPEVLVRFQTAGARQKRLAAIYNFSAIYFSYWN